MTVGKNTLTDTLASAVAGLPATDLAALDTVQLMRRFDTKYVIPETWLPDLIGAMTGHAHVLSVGGQAECAYDNLYFEMPGDQFLQDHLRGKARRMKVRRRTYASNGQSFLEVKQRLPGGRTVKNRMAYQTEDPATLGREEMDFLLPHLAQAESLKPRLHGAFLRTTLVDFTRKERVTVDRSLQTALFGDTMVPLLEGLVVIEVKQPRPDRYSPVQRWLRSRKDRKGLIGRNTRVSKYTMARLECDADIAGRAYLATYRRLQEAQSWAGDLQA